MAGVNDVVGVSGCVVGIAAGTGASASAAFTIARPGRHSHQTTVTWIETCGDAQLFVVALFQLGLYTWSPFAARAWNGLPDYVTSAPTYSSFRTALKTYMYLFSECLCLRLGVSISRMLCLRTMLIWSYDDDDLGNQQNWNSNLDFATKIDKNRSFIL